MAAAAGSANRIWRFGVYEADTGRAELRRAGTPVKLREQSFRILVHLLEHAGEIVTREELRGVLWPSDTFVDFDHSLNTAMMKLRNALGDSADAPLYIETIPKRGYRFVAPLSQAADGQAGVAKSVADSTSAAVDGAKEAEEAAPPEARTPDAHRWIWRMGAAAGLVLIAVAGLLVFLRTHRPPARPNEGLAASAFKIVPVTTAPGLTEAPAFSPDGRAIAYLWDGAERKREDVYVQLVGADLPLRLTYSKSGFVGPPAWSPDGREIAFSRCDGKNDGIYVVPALGGEERKLTSVSCFHTRPSGLAWFRDGKGLLMVDRCGAAGLFGIVLFSQATGEKRCVGRSGFGNDSDFDYYFSLSPDQKTVAFIPATSFLRCEVYTVPVSGGKPRKFTTNSQCWGNLMWTPDGKSIVFRSIRTGEATLWRIAADGGPMEPERTYKGIGSFSPDGRRLVYDEELNSEAASIWRADFASPGGPVLANQMLISSKYDEMDAQPSPDGGRVVWMSRRTGVGEIWTGKATGESLLPLTHLDTYSGTPRWSPDGRWIAFDSITGNGTQIFAVDAEGRNPHPITEGPFDNVVPSWSRDGKSIYFASNRTGSWQVWRHPLDGGGEAQLTLRGGFCPFESLDGQSVFFSKFDEAGIWSVPVRGGAESLVVADKPQVGYWGHWAVTRSGLYLLNVDAEPKARIEFFPFATQRSVPVLTLEKKPIPLQPSLSATADGNTVYYTQFDWQSAIKMMEIER
jgi:Tol biopolymer transport system component/DNA-binding winged helix-turn-helix (wHTH) protein